MGNDLCDELVGVPVYGAAIWLAIAGKSRGAPLSQRANQGVFGAEIACYHGIGYSSDINCGRSDSKRMDTRYLILAVCASLFAAPAMAETYSVGKSKGCEVYSEYKPSDDVDVKDGVDAKGWAIAPADLNAPAIDKQDFMTLDIPMDIPLNNYIDQKDYNVDLSHADIWAGRVQVDQDGTTRFNNQELKEQPYLPECER